MPLLRRPRVLSLHRPLPARRHQHHHSRHPPGFVPPTTADLAELRDRVSDFCRREIPATLAAETDRSNAFPAHMWKALGSAGLLGVTADPAHGGLGLGYQAHCVALEEISRASGSIGLSYAAHSQLCVNQIQLNGTDEQRARHLPGLVSGDTVGALAMSEAGAGSDVLGGMRTTARRVAAGWEITGTKMWITNGPDAGVVVLYARTDPDAGSRGVTAFIIDAAAAAAAGTFSCARKLDKMGMRGSNTGELVLESVFVPDADVLGPVGGGARVLMSGLDLERLVLSAGPIGLMRAALEDVAAPFVHQRRQFGAPVGHNQLVQGRLADMYTAMRAASALTYATARAADEGDGESAAAPVSGKDCAAAILFAAEAGTRVALDCIQLLGGMGYVEEMPASRILRDAKLYEIGAGTSEIRRIVIGRAFNREYGE